MSSNLVESNWEELRVIRLASLKESPEAFSASYEAALNRSDSEWRARASGSEGVVVNKIRTKLPTLPSQR